MGLEWFMCLSQFLCSNVFMHLLWYVCTLDAVLNCLYSFVFYILESIIFIKHFGARYFWCWHLFSLGHTHVIFSFLLLLRTWPTSCWKFIDDLPHAVKITRLPFTLTKLSVSGSEFWKSSKLQCCVINWRSLF